MVKGWMAEEGRAGGMVRRRGGVAGGGRSISSDIYSDKLALV